MTTALNESIGVEDVLGNIRAELARKRLKANRLPRVLGRSQAYWSRRLTGAAAISIEDLIALASALDVSVGVFFGEPSMKKPRPDSPAGALRVLPRLDSNQEPAEDQLDNSQLAPVIPLHPLKKAS